MRIEDLTRHTDNNMAHGRVHPLTKIVIHRFGGAPEWFEEQGIEMSLLGIERFFQTHKPGGLRELPYGFGILPDGAVEQGLPINKWNWHARGWSRESVAVAVFGDFRKAPPSEDQFDSLVDLCEALTVWGALNGRHVSINGHTELPDATSNPDHVCPGPHLDLNRVRQEVGERIQVRKDRHLDRWGLVL